MSEIRLSDKHDIIKIGHSEDYECFTFYCKGHVNREAFFMSAVDKYGYSSDEAGVPHEDVEHGYMRWEIAHTEDGLRQVLMIRDGPARGCFKATYIDGWRYA